MGEPNDEERKLNESKENRNIRRIDSFDGDSEQWNVSGENVWEADLNISIDDLRSEITENESIERKVSVCSFVENVKDREEDSIKLIEKKESQQTQHSQENAMMQNEISSEQLVINYAVDLQEREKEEEENNEKVDNEEKEKIFTNIRKTFEKYSMQYLISQNTTETSDDTKKETKEEPNDKNRQEELDEEISKNKDLTHQIKILENKLIEKETLINNLRENINTIASFQSEAALVKPVSKDINFLQEQQNKKAEYDQVIDKWNHVKNLCKMQDDHSVIPHIQQLLNIQEAFNQKEEENKQQSIKVEVQLENQKKQYENIITELEKENQIKEEELCKKKEQINILSVDAQQSVRDIQIYKEEIENVKKENEQLQEQTNEWNLLLQKEQHENKELKEMLTNLKIKLKDLENQFTEQKERNEQLKIQHDLLIKKEEIHTSELEEIKSQYEKEKEEFKKSNEEKYIQLEESNRSIQLEKEQIKKEKEELQLLIKEKEQREEKIKEHEMKYKEMKKDVENVENEREEYKRKYEHIQEEMEQLKNSQKQQATNHILEEEYEHLKKEYEELKENSEILNKYKEEYEHKYEVLQKENEQYVDKYEQTTQKIQQMEFEQQELINSINKVKEELQGKTQQIEDLQRQLENCELQLEKSQWNCKTNEEKWKCLLEGEKKKEECYINQIEHIKFEMKKLENEAYQRMKEKEDLQKTNQELREVNYDLKSCKEDQERTIQELKLSLQQSEKENFMKFGTFQEEQNRKIEHIMMENKKNCNYIDILKNEKMKLEEENNLLKKDVRNFEEQLKKIESYSYDIYEIKNSLQTEVSKNKGLIEQLEYEKNQKEDLKNQIKCFLMQNEKYNATIKVYKMKCNFLTNIVKNYNEQVNILQNQLQIYLQKKQNKNSYRKNEDFLSEETKEVVQKMCVHNQPDSMVKEMILLREQVEQEVSKKNEILQKLQKLLTTLKEKNLLINEKNYKIKKYKIVNETLQKNIENYQNNIKSLHENINDLQKQLELKDVQNLVIPPRVNIHLSKYSSLENNIKNEIKGLIGNSSNFLENTFKYINENTIKKTLPVKTSFQSEEKKQNINGPLSVHDANATHNTINRNLQENPMYRMDINNQETCNTSRSKDSLKDSERKVLMTENDLKEKKYKGSDVYEEQQPSEENNESIDRNKKVYSNESMNKYYNMFTSSEKENTKTDMECGQNKIAQLFNFKMDPSNNNSDSSNQKNENKIMDLFSFKKDTFNILKNEKQENMFTSMFNFEKSDKGKNEKVSNERTSVYNFAQEIIGMKSQENIKKENKREEYKLEEEERWSVSNDAREATEKMSNVKTKEHIEQIENIKIHEERKVSLFSESDLEQEEIFLEKEFRIDDEELEINKNGKKEPNRNHRISDEQIDDHFILHEEDVQLDKEFDIDDEEINEQFVKDFTCDVKNDSKEILKEKWHIDKEEGNVLQKGSNWSQLTNETKEEKKEKQNSVVFGEEEVDLQVTDMWNDEIDLENLDDDNNF